MRSFLGLCLLTAAMLPATSQAVAQSGVVSGPPQVNAGPSGPGPGPGAPDRPVPQQAGGTWIAVVGGFDGSGRSVGVGYSGLRGSRIDAEDAAIAACHRQGGRNVSCREPLAVSSGCLYIAPGSRAGGVTWGRGATRALALEECRRGGYSCNSGRVIGGCVSGYSN